MKVGDKVRFLNSTGGGTVKGFQGKDIAIVDDGGFDTPVLIRECVVIEPAGEVQVRQSVKQKAEESTVTEIEEPVKMVETKEGEKLTVYLAYLPVDIKKLSTTGYECYLINDSNYFLSYSYLNRTENGWLMRASGVIEPNTKLFLEEFEKTDLNDLEKICFQFIAYKRDKAFSLKNSYSIEIRLDTVKFYKLHSFRENDYFDDEALLYLVVKNDMAEKLNMVSTEELRLAMIEKQTDRKRKETIQKKKPENRILEIDLHINELIDNTNGLDSKDILEYQLNKFREVLSEYKNQKGKRIVFIHGKGDGILKNEILKELKAKYKSYYYQDASFREYGFGATMVTIK